jgi:NhaA family Na+:H+ antiporter
VNGTGRIGFVNILQEFSIPLIGGVAVAMLMANVDYETYTHIIHWKPAGDVSVFGHELTLHFLVNDVFMVFFFGIAAKEITEACLPGGSLNPPRKALNPLIATIGGVVGPVLIFLAGLWGLYELGVYNLDDAPWSELSRGWGIPTATDIALAWLVARAVFGKGHPAVDFLLLLAVADDAIGLVIIAVFYGDPAVPAEPIYLLAVLLGMAVAYGLGRAGVKHWWPYVMIGGPIAWAGLMAAHLHPALALVFVIPFMPGPKRDVALFLDRDEVDLMGEETAADLHIAHSPLHLFEHQMKLPVDLGLFFFAFANAGVPVAEVGPLTWLILGSLVLGKTIGITLFGMASIALGFPLPSRMGRGDLVMASFIAALGLTVALFVAGAAFTDPALLGQAKMGALFSGFVGLVAVLIARALGMPASRSAAAESAPARRPLTAPVTSKIDGVD